MRKNTLTRAQRRWAAESDAVLGTKHRVDARRACLGRRRMEPIRNFRGCAGVAGGERRQRPTRRHAPPIAILLGSFEQQAIDACMVKYRHGWPRRALPAYHGVRLPGQRRQRDLCDEAGRLLTGTVRRLSSFAAATTQHLEGSP